MTASSYARAFSPYASDDLAKECRIAVVPSMGLGDGCIYLILAANLARQGFDVTVYSNHLGSMDDWFSSYKTKVLPTPQRTFAVLGEYDLVISDLGSMVTRHGVDARGLGRSFVFVGTCKVDPRFIDGAASQRLALLPEEKRALLAPLAAAAGSLRCIPDDAMSIVDQAVKFCQLQFGFAEASKETDIRPPKGLHFRRFPERVMIHPLSYNAKKNWSAERFVQLAKRLRKRGFEPQFVLSAKERERYGNLFCETFEAPTFADASELAGYLYESGYVIGNDSGVGHIASLVGIPVLTLFRKRRDGFCWRPGWSTSAVVRPIVSIGLLRQRWTLFLSVSRVERAFDRLREEFEGRLK